MILKVVELSRGCYYLVKNSSKRPEGKKCNPYRQFGVSSDAPI